MAIADGFASKHGFVTGVIVIAVGVFGVIGSVSGNLAAMLAALFDPNDLWTIKAGGGGSIPPVIPKPNPGEPVPPNEPNNPSLTPGEPTLPALPGIPELPGIGFFGEVPALPA